MNDTNSIDDHMEPYEPPYQSAADAEIGHILDQYQIPFHYRQPVVVEDGAVYRTVHPAFTLPYHLDMIIEYTGPHELLSPPEEGDRREQLYRENGIPGVFLYPDDLQRVDVAGRLVDQIERAYRRAVPAWQYPTDAGYRDGSAD